MQLPEVNAQDSLEFLSKLIQIKSHTKSASETCAVEYMTKSMEKLGIESKTFYFTDKNADGMERCNSVGVWKGTGKNPNSKKLLFNGHVDVNPVTEGWTVDPYAGTYDDEYIYGIGVSNMKSGCCAYYMAVKTLIDNGWKVSKDVTLTYVVGELQGGVGTVDLIERGVINKHTADYFINCEPTDVQALIMHAGSTIFKVDITGDTRHMSKREEATDAIQCSMDAISRLTNLKFHGAKSDTHRSVNRCHVGTIIGGLGRNYEMWRPPQVADFVTITGAARYAPGQDTSIVYDDLNKELEETKKKFPKMKYEVSSIKGDFMPPFEVDPNASIVKLLNECYVTVRPEEAKQPTGALRPPCFYGSDAGHLYEKLNMEGVVCGPGGKYNTMPDEKVDIEDYLDCIKVFMNVIVRGCGGYKETA